MSLTTSEVNLYPISNLTPRKNFYIDDIESFLDQYEDTKTTLVNFQYVKHALTLTIKINWTQEALSFDLGKYGYLSIKNSDDTKVVYYFVMNRKWLGQSTIQLELAMDTINTLRYGTDYTLDDKTKINRQHKDRFTKISPTSRTYNVPFSGRTENIGGGIYRVTTFYQKDDLIGMPNPTLVAQRIPSNINIVNWSFDSASGEFTIVVGSSSQVIFSGTLIFVFYVPARYFRKIDLANEGITPILYGKDISVVDENNEDSIDWYLLYTGSTSVSCYAIPSGSCEVGTSGSSTINATDLVSGQYYYIIYDNRQSYAPVALTINSTTAHTGINKSFLYMLRYYRSGSDIVVEQLKYMNNGIGGFTFVGFSGRNSATSFSIASASDVVPITISSADIVQYSEVLSASPSSLYISSGFSFNEVNDISSVNRTDDKHIKLIKLPYRPFNLSDNYLDSNWTFNSTLKYIELRDLSSSLNSTIVTKVDSPLLPLEVDLSDISDEDRPDSCYESKLFHSDYYQPKFVYDSFGFIFALEKINISSYANIYDKKFTFDFSVTNTINSRFLFTFPSYIVTDRITEDFQNILYINRNNEEVLYNSAYISYIKNGYNYDVKTKERQELGQWLGIGISSVGAIASFAASGVTGGVSVAAGISLATSTMAQLVSAVNTTAQAEANMNQKLYQLRQQKAAVSSADAVDLMTQYCGNKAKLMLYEASPRMKKVLFDLFFYTGYVDGTLGIPNVTSRRRFNFVSCEPVFSWTKNIPEDVLTDIELKFNAGVTFIHHYNDEWDLDQSHENYETNI